MLPEIANIRRKRKLLDITQKELSKRTGISQSFIAKLESGRINPSYSHAKRIMDTLEALDSRERKDISTQRLCHGKILRIRSSEKLSEVARLMRKHGISQLPVFDGKRVVGSVSEKNLIDAMLKEKNYERVARMRASDIMEAPFPIVQKETPSEAVVSLLRSVDAVLMADRGEIVGIVTKADLVKLLK